MVTKSIAEVAPASWIISVSVLTLMSPLSGCFLAHEKPDASDQASFDSGGEISEAGTTTSSDARVHEDDSQKGGGSDAKVEENPDGRIVDGGGDAVEGNDGGGSNDGEYPVHATGLWKIVEYECSCPNNMDCFCYKEVGMVFEFEYGCLFEGDGCVDGLTYFCSSWSRMGYVSGGTDYSGHYNMEEGTWQISISHSAGVWPGTTMQYSSESITLIRVGE